MTKQKEGGISWTEETWNPLRGCSRISKGCMNCYAEGIAHRFGGEGQPYEGLIASTGQWNGTVKFVPAKLVEPIRWKRPRLIFVNSMSDLFHESVPDHEIDQIFGVMWACLGLDHTFQILTKRAKRMNNYFKTDRRDSWARWAVHYGGGTDPDAIYDQVAYADEPHPRIWLGVSAEDQATADERIPYLLGTPAAVRWLSAEPLIGPLDIYGGDPDPRLDGHSSSNTYIGDWWEPTDNLNGPSRHGLDWVVVGGESGAGARPMSERWALSLRDQCAAADVPFHFKQWGEFAPNWLTDDEGNRIAGSEWADRMGKKIAGRELDGREWNEYPFGYTKGKA